jgi:hypothetical protein
MDGADVVGSRFSLAHELAAALMPEPSAGAKLLADEFGIEYDEGAEGIDNSPHEVDTGVGMGDPAFTSVEATNPPAIQATPSFASDFSTDLDSLPGSPLQKQRPKQPEQDPMVILTRDMETTEQFLSHLRKIDAEAHANTSSSAGASSTGLEQMAADVIRRINDTARDREGQVRALVEYEREFRKISGEIGGEDVLGQLDELEEFEGLVDKRPSVSTATTEPIRSHKSRMPSIDTIAEEPDWESQMERDRRQLLGDDDGEEQEEDLNTSVITIKDKLIPAPQLDGPPTPARTISQLSHLRTFTASLVSSLSTISEQTQVNGAATADAGRKIRALKHKMGDVRADWEIAERSRAKIERWEAGIPDGAETPTAPFRHMRRVDGRKLVAEHLRAFELAISEAGSKTQAIMAGPA